MAINPTPTNYKTFTFDGTNSRSYGVYITGEGVFNAPERNVEMIEIPGRNGSFALDKGNFKNIEVTYPAGIFADTASDFATAVSDLRNFLCSKNGYVRLEDDYNTGEYRLAIYKSGLEVDHDMLTSGEFDIVFECKPQRYLTSGETAVAVASGGTLTNPTLFPSQPQLQVWGYGNVSVGNQGTINIQDVPLGIVQLASYNQTTFSDNATSVLSETVFSEFLDTGDTFDVTDIKLGIAYRANPNYFARVVDGSITNETNCTGTIITSDQVVIIVDNNTFTKGTSKSVTYSLRFTLNEGSVGTSGNNVTANVNGSISYNGSTGFTVNLLASSATYATRYKTINIPDIFGYSTLSASNPLYIDLDIGEAYAIVNGNISPFNNAVNIPAELPTLPSGDTTFTYDNTITQFKVVPRWWKV